MTEQAVDSPATESIDARATAITERLRAEPVETPAVDAGTETTEVTVDPKAERAKRLEDYRARERKAQERRARDRASEQGRQAAADATRERDALKAEVATLRTLRDDIKNPAKFIALAKEIGVPADALGAFISESMNDPGTHAAKRAREAIDPELSARDRKIAELESRLDGFVKKVAEQEVETQTRADESKFVSHMQTIAAQAPMAHAALTKFGEKAFVTFANACAESLPAGVGLQALVDKIEHTLESEWETLGQLRLLATGQSVTPSQTNTRNHAAAKATTLSNRSAQARASVPEEVDATLISLDERAARIKRRLGA